jgi:hypothetical protein
MPVGVGVIPKIAQLERPEDFRLKSVALSNGKRRFIFDKQRVRAAIRTIFWVSGSVPAKTFIYTIRKACRCKCETDNPIERFHRRNIFDGCGSLLPFSPINPYRKLL